MSHPDKPEHPTEVETEHTYKGSVHWYQFQCIPEAKTIDDIHPCIVIGKNNSKSSRVIISPISDAENYLKSDGTVKYNYHVLLEKSKYTFLEKDSVILLDQVFTIPKSDLCEEWYMGAIEEVRQIDEGIMTNYDLISTVSALLHEMVDKLAQSSIA